jgi:hypothetical protein
VTGTSYGVATFDVNGNAFVLEKPSDTSNKVLGWSNGVLAWIVATVALVATTSPTTYEQPAADQEWANQTSFAQSGVYVSSFDGTSGAGY